MFEFIHTLNKFLVLRPCEQVARRKHLWRHRLRLKKKLLEELPIAVRRGKKWAACTHLCLSVNDYKRVSLQEEQPRQIRFDEILRLAYMLLPRNFDELS